MNGTTPEFDGPVFFFLMPTLCGILVFQKYLTLNLMDSQGSNWDPIYSLSPTTRGPLLVYTSNAFKSLPPQTHYSGVTFSGCDTATICTRFLSTNHLPYYYHKQVCQQPFACFSIKNHYRNLESFFLM